MARMPKQARSKVAASVGVAICIGMFASGSGALAQSTDSTPTAEQTAQSDCANGIAPSGTTDAASAQPEQLFTEQFPCILDQLIADPPSDSSGASTTASNQAPTGSESGDPLSAGPPLTTPQGAPVDLTLEHKPDGYTPADPRVDLTLPNHLDQGVPIGDSGVTLDPGATDPAAATSANADPLRGQGLFYADAAPSTDVLLAPISPGLETVYQLRSADSPEHLEMGVNLPAGASLESATGGDAQVVDGGQSVASFYSPVAADADGNPVPTSMSASGDSLDIDVPHSNPDLAYPIAVTVSAGSFAPAQAATAATVLPGMNGVSPSNTEGDKSAEMGVRVLRYSMDWCGLEPTLGNYQRSALQGVVDFAHYTAQKGMRTLVDLYTNAPDFARTDGMKQRNGHSFPCASKKYDNGAASIAPSTGDANTIEYGLAMRKIAWCLNGDDTLCNQGVVGGNVDTHGSQQLLDNHWIYGFEAGNEVNTAQYWQNCNNDPPPGGTCDGTIKRADANTYWKALAAAAFAVHQYAPNAQVGSAGLSYGTPDGHAFPNSNVDGTSYLDQVLSNGDSGADAYSIHPYGKALHADMVSVNGVPGNSDVGIDAGGARQILLNRGYGYTKPIWITEVGVDADCNNDGTGVPCHDDNRVTFDEQVRQYDDLYFTWWNSIRGVCDSWNIPLAVFYTFKDQAPSETVFNNGDTPDYYAGFTDVVDNPNPPPPNYVANYAKVAFTQFDSGQVLAAKTCTG